ncbi:MAG TPA: low-specificity L-threonine aldolase [Clostridiales bacterium]|jgi:threonine aldolase|nr:low-specificity L-threonine aldolase [Clostridiales bacterium]HQP70491.1 low-specificity L-threonine aldolase [Clostridiales bacterium]
MKIIDLRSDTVTRPSEAMRKAMYKAEVGDDVYGDDPTVNRLEGLGAEMLGTEAAIFATSGTQANLLALLAHCERGDEYIVGQHAHTYKYEGGGAAVLGSIQPQPLEMNENGMIDLKVAKTFIKDDDDFHYSKTRLLCLENTYGGRVVPMEYLKEAHTFAGKHKLKLHLDGARVFNAAVKLNIDVKGITKHFDSVQVCLSKGLGAPVGSLLCSSKEVIDKARRWRKVLGGGMRQAGIIAAGGIYALEHNVHRLSEDHKNAKLLAEGLSKIDGIKLDLSAVETNMVFIELTKNVKNDIQAFMQDRNILISGHKNIRLVTHLDVDEKDIKRVVAAFNEFFK